MQRLVCIHPLCRSEYKIASHQNNRKYCDCGSPITMADLKIELIYNGKSKQCWHLNENHEIIVGRASKSTLFNQDTIVDLAPYLDQKTEVSRTHLSLVRKPNQQIRVCVISKRSPVVINRQNLSYQDDPYYATTPFQVKISSKITLHINQ